MHGTPWILRFFCTMLLSLARSFSLSPCRSLPFCLALPSLLVVSCFVIERSKVLVRATDPFRNNSGVFKRKGPSGNTQPYLDFIVASYPLPAVGTSLSTIVSKLPSRILRQIRNQFHRKQTAMTDSDYWPTALLFENRKIGS